MGRAIVREPRAFLMDEPLSNLDAKLRVGMRASLSAAPRAARGDDDLRHARSDGGDDARSAGRRDARRADRPGRRAPGALRPSARRVRGRVHRLAGDEPRRGEHRRRVGPVRSARVAARSRQSPGGPGWRTASCSESGPRPSRTARSAPSRLPRLGVHVDVVEELGADTHACFGVERAGRPSTRGRRARTRALLATEATLFTARLDPRTIARQGDDDRARGRSREVPLLRRRRRLRAREAVGGDASRHCGPESMDLTRKLTPCLVHQTT